MTFRRRVHDLVADCDERLADREARSVEIDVTPPQAEELAATDRRHRGERPGRLKPSPAHVRNEGAELIWVPGVDSASGPPRRAPWLGSRRDVLPEQACVDRVGEHLVQRRADVAAVYLSL